ncbi:hypothetical protein [Mastigocoleus sp. MO_188.B34]|uniref:hypothetical protein n=1 Tax=Mastigocoleus sp. MO_188.B34 TaxID=3036635 RepID=UPI0026064B53|nr:hypothetical protein [Mastigocoleus sp. MO_188.B34]MDJ0695510.1 hypothetical protein [Mastigocoleus sp. MO_188.B34]
MSRRNVPLSNLFVELSELEQSVISGGFTNGNNKPYLSHSEDKILDNSNTFTAYNSTQVSVIENFSIENSLNNLLGSSTFSLSAESIGSSSVLISGNSSSTEALLHSEIFAALPTRYKDEVSKVLDNNNINNFALSITNYSANIQGTETFNLSGSAGNIATSSSWSLDVDTAAVSGIFFPQTSSNLDLSHLIPGNNQFGTQLTNKQTNISNFALSFTYYSADFQQTDVSRISGLLGSAFTSSALSVNIDTEALSGIFLSKQVSSPLMLSGTGKEGITSFSSQNISNSFFVNESLGSSDNLWLSLNTVSGIAGSQAALSGSWERISDRNSNGSGSIYANQRELDLDSLFDSNFGAGFGFSTSNYHREIYSTKSYLLSGNVGSSEELIASILGITPNSNENIQDLPFSNLSSGSSTGLPIASVPIASYSIDISPSSGLDTRLTEFGNYYTINNLNSSGFLLENISGVRLINDNNHWFANLSSGTESKNLNSLLSGSDLNSQLRTIELDSIGLTGINPGINHFENLQGLTFDSSINTYKEKDNYLDIGNLEIGDYTLLNSNVFKFNTSDSNISSIGQDSIGNLNNSFKTRTVNTNFPEHIPSVSSNLMPSMFLLLAANNFDNSILAFDKTSITKIANLSQKYGLGFRNKNSLKQSSNIS